MAGPITDISATCIVPEGSREQFLPSLGSDTVPAHGILSAGLSRLVPGYDFGRLKSPSHILEFTIDGSARYLTTEKGGTFRAGDVFIGPARTDFRYWVDRGHWTSLWFCLDDREPWSTLSGKHAHVRRTYAAPWLLHAAEGLLAEVVRNEPFSQRLRELFAEQIRLLLRRELESFSAPHESAMRNRIHSLWLRVSADLAHPWTVPELAGIVNLSPPHFHRVVSRYMGATPREVLTDLRMKRTEELLLNRALPLKAIADLVGYATPYALSKAFTRHKGVSPAAFRAHHRA